MWASTELQALGLSYKGGEGLRNVIINEPSAVMCLVTEISLASLTNEFVLSLNEFYTFLLHT